jgi:hypothetical protein
MSELNEKYSNAKYLIYSTWETQFHLTPSKICGSLLIDSALTDEEAKKKVEMYEKNRIYSNSTKSSIIYIQNKEHWWK